MSMGLKYEPASEPLHSSVKRACSCPGLEEHDTDPTPNFFLFFIILDCEGEFFLLFITLDFP